MDIVFRPDGNFDEVYLYVGIPFRVLSVLRLTERLHRKSSWRPIYTLSLVEYIGLPPPLTNASNDRFDLDSLSLTPTSNPSCTKLSVASNTSTQLMCFTEI